MSAIEEIRAKLNAAAERMEEAAGKVNGVASDDLGTARGAVMEAMEGSQDNAVFETLGYIDRAADMGEQMSGALMAAAQELRAIAGRL